MKNFLKVLGFFVVLGVVWTTVCYKMVDFLDNFQYRKVRVKAESEDKDDDPNNCEECVKDHDWMNDYMF